MPVFVDMTLNLNLDNELIKIARSINPIIPIHRTGGLETDSVTWYGWYKKTYFDLIDDPEAFPLEFGGEAVSYSMAGAMDYYENLWPIDSQRNIEEWEYHALEFPCQENYIGRSTEYDSFNEWAFASQLYQAVVIKYHIEINRENRYSPTGSVLQYMYNDWWPSVNFGFTDWNLEEKISLSWIRNAFSPQLVATRVSKNIYSQGDKIEIPIHVINDEYNDFKNARVKWRLVEETDSFIIKGYRISPTFENRRPVLPVTATVGHQIPVAEVDRGEFEVDLPLDGHVMPGSVSFNAPKTEEPKHYTLYMTLTSSDGRVLSENRDHFMVVKNAKTFRPPEGISPKPRFKLVLGIRKKGKPISNADVEITDKYSAGNRRKAKLDHKGRAEIKEMLPGAYVLKVNGESYEFLLNRDEIIEIDFREALKRTLGTVPIIEWREGMERPSNN